MEPTGKRDRAELVLRIRHNPLEGGVFCTISPVCQSCGKSLEKPQVYNLAVEKIDLTVRQKKCRECRMTNNFRVRCFSGANKEVYIGIGPADSEITTASGVITISGGIWDPLALGRLARLGLRVKLLPKNEALPIIHNKADMPLDEDSATP